MEITTGRPASYAPNGMVTSSHSLASSAGVDVLRAGGSAVDAAIATSAVLSDIYPHMTGLGGDAFWLIREARSGKIRYLNGGGRAAASATLARMVELGHDEIPYFGIVPATLTTPGAVASWSLAHEAYGRLPLSRILKSAIGYARDGFPVTERLAQFTDMVTPDLAKHRESAALFLPNGEAPSVGSYLSNKNLARTLESYAQDGWSGFYEGEVAREMARFSAENAAKP